MSWIDLCYIIRFVQDTDSFAAHRDRQFRGSYRKQSLCCKNLLTLAQIRSNQSKNRTFELNKSFAVVHGVRASAASSTCEYIPDVMKMHSNSVQKDAVGTRIPGLLRCVETHFENSDFDTSFRIVSFLNEKPEKS